MANDAILDQFKENQEKRVIDLSLIHIQMCIRDRFIDVAWESLNHYGEELCGDKVEIVRKDDYVLAVLADGLGSGVKANILSTMTSKIISTLYSEGGKLSDVVETCLLYTS